MVRGFGSWPPTFTAIFGVYQPEFGTTGRLLSVTKEPAKAKRSNGKAAGKRDDADEFDRFQELTRKLVSVPKRGLDKKRDAAKNGNGR